MNTEIYPMRSTVSLKNIKTVLKHWIFDNILYKDYDTGFFFSCVFEFQNILCIMATFLEKVIFNI